MTDSIPRSARRQWTRFVLIALVVIGADQVSKWMALDALTTTFSPALLEQSVESAAPELAWTEKFDRFWSVRHPARARTVTVLRDFWRFRYVENPGAAWGFLAGADASFRTPFFLLVTILAMGFILVYFHRLEPGHRLLRLALALVFGGAIGNFIDRARLGYVIDFIDWHWYDKATWPTFNVADSAITVGVILMLVDMFLQSPGEPSLEAGGR